MAALCELIVAPSQWVYAALAANGIPLNKLSVSRQAVSQSFVDRANATARRQAGKELTIGFIGRLEHYKGAHILLEAMKQIPTDVPVQLKIAGSGTERPYLRTLESAAGKDKRIKFLGSITRDQVPEFMSQIDVLAVPSNYMETGPLVVLEAFAFNLPVMGAKIGGIAERIRDGVDGWLLPFDDSSAWAKAIKDAALDRPKVARLVANILPSRTMDDVAGEMATLYDRILAERAAGAATA